MPKKNIKTNPFDELVRELAVKFTDIPGFNLMLETSEGRELLDFIIRRFNDLHRIRALYIGAFLPAINKSNEETMSMMRTSRYSQFLVINRDEIKETTYYETIRFGYVHLFHTMESFYSELLSRANSIAKDGETVQKWMKQKYDVRIDKHWKNIFPVAKKITWIANCVKHNDGFPNEETMTFPEYSLLHPIGVKIKIEKDEFKKDIEGVKDIFDGYMHTIYTFVYFQNITKSVNEVFIANNPSFIEKYSELEESIRPFVESFRKN